MTNAATETTVPALAVTRGAPTPDELAALLVVLAARRAAPASRDRADGSLWSARSGMLRAAVHAGPGSWRASALPR